MKLTLRQLAQEIEVVGTEERRQWRTLRVLYIIRNVTAHVIEPGLELYNDRDLALRLLQLVLIAGLMIEQIKRAPLR